MKARWDAHQKALKAEHKRITKAANDAKRHAPTDGLVTSKPKRGKMSEEEKAEKAEAKRLFGLTDEEREAEDANRVLLHNAKGKGTTNATIKEDGMTGHIVK